MRHMTGVGLKCKWLLSSASGYCGGLVTVGSDGDQLLWEIGYCGFRWRPVTMGDWSLWVPTATGHHG